MFRPLSLSSSLSLSLSLSLSPSLSPSLSLSLFQLSVEIKEARSKVVRIKSETSQVLLSTCLYLSLCAYLSAYMSPQHEVHRPACRSISAISSSHAFIDQPDILLYHIAPSLPFSSLLSFSTSLHSTLSYRIVSYRIVLYLIISYLIRELRPTLL
jgi:hypothetical protein